MRFSCCVVAGLLMTGAPLVAADPLTPDPDETTFLDPAELDAWLDSARKYYDLLPPQPACDWKQEVEYVARGVAEGDVASVTDYSPPEACLGIVTTWYGEYRGTAPLPVAYEGRDAASQSFAFGVADTKTRNEGSDWYVHYTGIKVNLG